MSKSTNEIIADLNSLSVGLSDSNDRETLSVAASRLSDLAAECNALAAHVERLCEKITEYHSEDIAAEEALNNLAVIVADIPNQSLAEHDAEVARKAFSAGYLACNEDYSDGVMSNIDPDCESEEKAHEYAEQVKRGEL